MAIPVNMSILKKVGGLTGVANMGFASMTYNSEREAGNGIAGSAAYAAVDMALPAIIGMPMYIGGMIASGIPGAVMSGAETMGTASRQLAQAGRNVPFGNTTFVDTEQAYTMRQAGMMLAKRSKENVQQTLMGQEARNMHR